MSSLPESLLRFRTELEDAIGRELEAQGTARSNGWGARVIRAVRRRPGRTALALAAVAGAAATALFVSSPWKGSPGFLERAQAALTPPEGMILHAAWNVSRTSPEYGCTVTVGPNELWADMSPPYRYRRIERQWPSQAAVDRRSMACGESIAPAISGGTASPDVNVPPTVGFPLDDLKGLRAALAEGYAHDEGQVELNGLAVERIRVDCRNPCPVPDYSPVYWYVDRETFRPVQFECLKCMTFGWRSWLMTFDILHRYRTYEYLPRTAANVALTDIRAQHPDSTGP